MNHSRRAFIGTLSFTPALLAASGSLRAADAAPAAELAVMTYNLRYAGKSGPNAWTSRRPLIKALIDAKRPDLIGTQEGLYEQLKDVAADQPNLAWIGLGRDGGSHGEFMAIFYRKERFEPLEYDHFWLSDTPEVIASSTWGNTNRRMVTWVRFKDHHTGKQFYHWNTHLDHALQPAREKAARLIRDRLTQMQPELPLVLTGDFNAVNGANPAYDIFVADNFLKDTWKLAGERRNADLNTFNGFGAIHHKSERIDWILGRGIVAVRATEIVVLDETGPFPSDHFPVMSWLTLP
jgi:endonuclease/exonuclease/phosphatase family metal-dependent hydrolase